MSIHPPSPTGVATGIVLALLVGAGTATAGALITGADIKDGSVTSADVKNDNLQSGDIKDGTITSADVRNDNLQSGDIKDGTITSADLKNNNVASGDIKDGTVGLQDINDETEAALTTGGALVVSALSAPWAASNGTVSMTPDGIEFGPYADGGAASGSLLYNGLNGLTLADVENLVYYARYTATDDTGGVGVPYLRVFLNDSDGIAHDAIFSPNTQAPDADVAEGPFHEWVATSGSWRYDDDEGAGPDMAFEDLVADHGTDVITSLRITTGSSAGTDLSSLLRRLQINGQTFQFGG